MIAPMLQMPGISHCLSVEIEVSGRSNVLHNYLPTNGISYWLENSSASDEKRTKSVWKEKSMEIRMPDIQNVRELVDHLKMVYCILF